MNSFDVIIIGAGLGGINSAYRLQRQLPHLSYIILETRDEIGGTWDLFRYPGIRSDSDLDTYGFAWKPWNQPSPIGKGAEILNYMKEAAAGQGINRHIEFRRRLRSASWSSGNQRWTLTVDDQSAAEGKRPLLYSARFLLLCTGYFDFHQPLETVIPGLENFQGQVVHPQFWPEDLDYAGKNVVVVGSGATAITLVPATGRESCAYHHATTQSLVCCGNPEQPVRARLMALSVSAKLDITSLETPNLDAVVALHFPFLPGSPGEGTRASDRYA